MLVLLLEYQHHHPPVAHNSVTITLLACIMKPMPKTPGISNSLA